MKSLIVDDEPLARRELRRLLEEFPWVEIVGEAGDVEEAEARIEALAPELLFLDIQMPGGSGFDLLARLDHPPQVIFTTAYDHHAVRAFEVSALDYLLKPIEPLDLREQERVRITVERLPQSTDDDRADATRRFVDGADRSGFRSTGRYPTRDELHERG